MSGLRRICKLYGGMTVTSNGKTINYVWDYANDEPVPDSEMPFGSDRHKASERARWEPMQDSPLSGAKQQSGKDGVLVSGSGDRGREPTDEELLEQWNAMCDPYAGWCDKMRSMIRHFGEGGGREPSPTDGKTLKESGDADR